MSDKIKLELTRKQLKLINKAIRCYNFGCLPPIWVDEELDLFDKIKEGLKEIEGGD